MDIEQAAKTIKWLDEERRKDKQEFTALQERLAALQQEFEAQTRRVKELESSATGANALSARFAKLEELVLQVRTDTNRQMEVIEQRRADGERELEKARGIEREGTTKMVVELRKSLESVPARLDQEIQARKDEEARLSRLLLDLQQRVNDFDKQEEERLRMFTALEETRRTESKRLVELQVDVGDLRKKQDELRGRADLVEDLVRRNDARISEVATAETERRSQQFAWMEQQAVQSAERDRRWNEWEERFTSLQTQAEDFARRMEAYAETYRAMRNLKDDFQVTIDRLERKINETGELQRLAEERARQDWTAFQADDQKRWTTHMLLRDEQWREHDRLEQKSLERLTALEEHVAEAQDVLRTLNDNDAARLGALMNLMRDWLAEHDLSFAKVK